MSRLLGLGWICWALVVSVQGERVVASFNDGWSFQLGEVPEPARYEPVKVPHDWSVAFPFSTNGTGGCTAFLPGGVGWYEKRFELPPAFRGRRVRIDFDGVYNNAEVWLNGKKVGERPYGYIPFSFDLTPFLNQAGENTMVVKADRSAYMDCRWYPGSGIYREVQWVAHEEVYVEQYGLFVTTVSNERVRVETTLVNDSSQAVALDVEIDLQEADGRSAAFQVSSVSLAAGERKQVVAFLSLPQASVWSPDTPYLYRAEVSVQQELNCVDRVATLFGVRDLQYDPARGFFLNGERTVLKGVCLHHEGGAVGAAVPDDVWERRLRYLKEMGANAIRTAHNPPSRAFLDLCDRMGFLVQDEAFDEWFNPKDKKYNFNQRVTDERSIGYSEQFGAWAERDVKAMVLRDRNHPSIIMWSIGNEIEWTYPRYGNATGYWNKPRVANYYWDLPPHDLATRKEIFEATAPGEHVLAETADALAQWIKEVDDSRVVTANVVMPSVSYFSGYIDALDIVGYSYRTVLNEWGGEHYPDKLIVGTENWPQWNEWRGVLENEHIAGLFIWTGIDYLGESRSWPKRSTESGLMSTAGFRKPAYWFFKSLWNDEPMVRLNTQRLIDSNYKRVNGEIVENPDNPRDKKWWWPHLKRHWNYDQHEPIYVEVHSNCEEVELFVNERSLGCRVPMESEDRMVRWSVPFAAGALKAVGRNDGQVVTEEVLKTAGEPVGIQLSPDRRVVEADGVSVVHVEAQLIDAAGNAVRHVDQMVSFAVEGGLTNIGVDNGWYESVQPFRSKEGMTHQGRCLIHLQAGHEVGMATLTVSGEKLSEKRMNVRIR